jgi:hypothetical protein
LAGDGGERDLGRERVKSGRVEEWKSGRVEEWKRVPYGIERGGVRLAVRLRRRTLQEKRNPRGWHESKRYTEE